MLFLNSLVVLGICSLEAVVGRDGNECIIEINDSATTLMGESQEEDRKNIAELVLAQMEVGITKLLQIAAALDSSCFRWQLLQTVTGSDNSCSRLQLLLTPAASG